MLTPCRPLLIFNLYSISCQASPQCACLPECAKLLQFKGEFEFERSMEEPSKINAEIGLKEKNTILQAWTDFKDSIFNVIFVILDKKSEDEEEESVVRLALESGLDYLQIMAFPFHELVIDAWNGGESLSGLARFFNRFSIGSYLPGAPFSAFLVVLYGLIFIILLIIMDIVYVSYSFSKKKFRFTFPLVVLAQVVPLFVTVLFLPITEVLFNVVECEKDAELGWVMASFPTVKCWDGWHLFHSSVTLLFVAIFVLISCVVALALFEPRMTAGKLTARQNSNGQVVFILNKIVLLFLFIFKPFDGTAFYVTALFLLSFWQFWCYSVKQPYYSKAATKFFKVCSTYYFWTALMLFVGQLIGPFGFDGALVIWMSGLPFFAVIVYFESPADVNTLFVSNLKFKSGEQLESHVSYVLQLVGTQATDKNSYMLLIGYIEKHKEICNEADCPLKAERRRKRGEENMEQSCQQVLKQVERMFRSGVKKFPECTKLRLSFAFFQLQQLKNKEKAYQQFSAAAKLDPSFQQQFNIYRFKKIIRENLESREGSDADLIETIRFQNYVSLLQEAMLLSAKLHKEFWTELKEEIPDLKKLNLVGAQITEAGNSIAENYSELAKINASACEVLYSYGHYLILVSEDYAQGREMLANARKIFQDRQSGHRVQQELHFEQHSLNKMTAPVLILTHPAPGSLPRIKNANLMFTEVTGYPREELLDREVSRIAPKLFEQEGVSPLEFGGEERERQGFLNHKFNHLISVQYSMTQREGDWHVVFKLASSTSMRLVMLADASGTVTDSNLLAQAAFKDAEAQAVSEGRTFTLRQIGLQSFSSPAFRRPNGCLAPLRLGGRVGQCLVQVQAVSAHVYAASGETEDEEEQMVMVSERNLGFKISVSRSERSHLSQSELSSESGWQRESPLDGGVLELYQNPDVIDIFISNLAETRQLEESSPRFQLREKIKTMRLLNNQIKMVYAQGTENEYSDAQGSAGGEDERELFKFDDEGYQAKLRAAINTNLNHVEVANLRRASLAFLLLLFALNALQLYFEASEVDKVNNYLKEGLARAQEYSLLTSNIMAVIDSTANYSSLFAANSEHEVMFSSDVVVQLQLENSLVVSRNLKDAVILLNSRLLSYFQQPSSPAAVSSLFLNYIAAIYPAFLNYPGGMQVDLSVESLLAGAVGVVAVAMMCYWIYIGLLIDKKRYDIMIWFLDIPVPYVAHLGNHCDKYLKEFATVKELSQRGISLEEDEDAFEEYSNKRGAAEEEEIEEQIKARKSLISKNKKETLISKLNLGSLKVLWLILYASCFSVLMLVLSKSFKSDYSFLMPQWEQTSQAITIDNTLYLVLQMQENNISAGSTNLEALASKLKLDHKGVITENNLEKFNYNILTFHLSEVAAIYNTVYFSNLCTVLSLSPSNLTHCQTLVGSKLKSGYEVYSKYLITPEKSMSKQVWLANQLYVVPALGVLLQVWEEGLGRQGSGMISLCTILLYVFVILSVLAFLLLWLYYLRKLNTELNQTIQMLNMIPFKLLPKSRKETKLFIAWIIREANKTKHENQ